MKTSAIVLLAIVLAGCSHKPSTRLNQHIQYCEEMVMNLPTPEDADSKFMEHELDGRALDLLLQLPKGGREYNAFNAARDEYSRYKVAVDFRALRQNENMPDDAQNEYQLTKAKFRDAAAILKEVQAAE